MKTALSFYLDDTNSYDAPPEAFKTLLDFCASEGVRGESSIILGMKAETHGALSRPTTNAQREYLKQLERSFECGLDGHLELMSHGGLFDFASGTIPTNAIHEGLWLHEPAVSVEAYESYFWNIVEEAKRNGLAFTGVTWPGCDCQACEQRFAQLRREESFGVNPKVWSALLNVAMRGGFRGRAVPCFTFSSSKDTPRCMASEAGYSIWDIMPNMGDKFGSYINSPEQADVDYYITSDGKAGRIIELMQAGEPLVMFYAHWQGLNPANGVGWQIFTQLVDRVHKFLGDRIEWVRPSEYAERLTKT